MTALEMCKLELLTCMESMEGTIKKLKNMNREADIAINREHLEDLVQAIVVVEQDIEGVVLERTRLSEETS